MKLCLRFKIKLKNWIYLFLNFYKAYIYKTFINILWNVQGISIMFMGFRTIYPLSGDNNLYVAYETFSANLFSKWRKSFNITWKFIKVNNEISYKNINLKNIFADNKN